MNKIVIRTLEHNSYVYFISRKDNEDFDDMISNLSLTHLFDEEGEAIGDELKNVIESIQPDTWNPTIFIEWFNKLYNNNYDSYKAKLE